MVLLSIYPREVCGRSDRACPGNVQRWARDLGSMQGAFDSVEVFRDSAAWRAFEEARAKVGSPACPYPPHGTVPGVNVDWTRSIVVVIGYSSMDNFLNGSYRDLNRVNSTG